MHYYTEPLEHLPAGTNATAFFVKARALALLAVLCFAAGAARAQSTPTGTLTGVVADVNGAAVPNANVTAKNRDTALARSVTSDGEGRWTIPALPAGTYDVTYEAGGFKKLVSQAVAVEASVPRTLDARLEVGDIAGEVVTVTGESVAVTTPDTATLSRQISAEQLVAVPTSTRSFTQLLNTEAGVSADLAPVSTNSNGNQSPSVNGTRTTSTSLFFNGVDATNITTNEGSLNDNIAPAPETLQEVKLQTSLYDASTGRSGGGNFQLVTKTGTNSFNGTAYYYIQNEKLNANDFFFNKEGIDRPKARRNEGGFTIGGPVVRERFFFFGGYQYTNAVTGFVPTARSTSVVPLAFALLGNDRTAQSIANAFNAARDQFRASAQGGQLAPVCASTPLPAGCLTASDISPVAVNLLNLRNPATGDFILAAPRAGQRIIGYDRTNRTGAGAITTRAFQFGNVPVTSRALFEDNPLVQQLNVLPSEFEQHQFTARLDGRLTSKNTLAGTFFFSNFPALDSFPDPSSLVSPFVLRRADRNRTLAVSDQHIFSPSLINEARFGYFSLNNTRALDEPYLAQELTSEAVGISNPALLFDDSPATRRLGHFIGRPGTNLSQFSFGGPNDSFNKRKQQTYSFADNVTWITGAHTLRFGGDFKSHRYDSSLPEEQATEFEKFDSITQLVTGNATEADTQFGLTEKSFRFKDYSGYVADDWKLSRRLTMNLGLRYELFMWPTEKDGRIGNFDFDGFEQCFSQTGGTLSLCDNPAPGFIVPSNVRMTGLGNVDGAIAATARVDNDHTLRGQDTNNFAPRVGLAYSPFDSNRVVVRGGFGVFFDRPSAAFINTVFSNYPFLREIEITVPSGNVPLANAFGAQPTTLPLSNWLPFRIVRASGAGGSYVIRDATGVTADARGNPTVGVNLGNIAETFEFRAVDRDLKTPYVQQWNLGVQYEVTKNLLFEARYVGTRGRDLLQALAFNQGYDLNDPSTPDHIYERFNQAYLAAGSPNGPLNAGATARERGAGRAFGFANPYRVGQTATCAGGVLGGVAGAPVDLNLANPLTCSGTTIGGGQVINFEARVPVLGFNVPEALLLQSNGNSIYHGAQFSLTKRFSDGLQFNAAYTFSKSLDTSSTDPGSTAGSGKPDVPNTGFVVQGDQRNVEGSRAVSDFDRTHRLSLNFVYQLPGYASSNRLLNGWQLSGFLQAQTGTPYSIFAPEPELQTAPQYADLVRGSGGLYRLGFGRPALCGSLEELSRQGADITEDAFDSGALCTAFGQNGSLGRNALRAPAQHRFDLGLVKSTKLTETTSLELGWDVFNVFNRANFAAPDSELGSPDFGRITNTTGGPRVMQFRAKLKF
ncbi:MAG TPA: carboxypeptidase-like regulatory domain-containing protein [Pyrinomonadaceae bacterium]|nr:carboxypeptidase-like regulatory domain-containing protein [Pyrinomonadaceae bacterium]